jgi:hypothetical protein
MRAKDTFSQAQLRLQAAGCRYRIKQASRSPYIQVYDTLPPRRQQAARAFRLDDDQACWDLAELLLRAHERAVRGGPALSWEVLEAAHGQAPTQKHQRWGEICAEVQAWIAPGGPKARDRNPFTASSQTAISAAPLLPTRSRQPGRWRSSACTRRRRCSSGGRTAAVS